MKTFKDLKSGDRIYVYQRMKIGYYTIIDIHSFKETSTRYTWNHQEIKTEKHFTLITYKNSQNKEFDIEFEDSQLDNYESKTTYGRDPIFADREAAIKYVTDLYNYRLKKLADLQVKYDKEKSYVEKYQECLKNIPD